MVDVKAIMAINNDPTLTEEEKAKRRQALMMGTWADKLGDVSSDEDEEAAGEEEAKIDETLTCPFCHHLCERPVSADCGHNYCLKCFNKWVRADRKSCPTCRQPFPHSMLHNPRINTALVMAIRMAREGKPARAGASRNYVRIGNADRPETAFTTERAQRTGLANAASGKILVSVPNDWFGPIGAEHDPTGSGGCYNGREFTDRLNCRQWGAHFPHVAGISGQASTGAQSVVISGGYEDDVDQGYWFLYTGSGGRDLSGNKRTNKVQSKDQEFTHYNEALRKSCEEGLPIRVVRSCKEKRSAFAPLPQKIKQKNEKGQETEVVNTLCCRYDGIYRIFKAWRRPTNAKTFEGDKPPLVCRYLFIRCDNEQGVWDGVQDPDPAVPPADVQKEIDKAMEEELRSVFKGKVYEPKGEPYWGWIEDTSSEHKGRWGWLRPAPASKIKPPTGTGKKRAPMTQKRRLEREFACGLCRKVLQAPYHTPCDHNFCKQCLDGHFAAIDAQTANSSAAAPAGGRSLRARKAHRPCPSCKADLSDWHRTAQINKQMEETIQKLMKLAEKEEQEAKEGTEGDNAGEAEAEGAAGAEGGEGDDNGDGAADGAGDAAAAGPSGLVPDARGGSSERGTETTAEAETARVAAVRDDPQGAEVDRIVAELASEFPSFEAGFVEAFFRDQVATRNADETLEDLRAGVRKSLRRIEQNERRAKVQQEKGAAGAASPAAGKKRERGAAAEASPSPSQTKRSRGADAPAEVGAAAPRRSGRNAAA